MTGKKNLLFILLISGLFSACNKSDISFAEDVAPIIYDHCVSCHRDGGTAPFSLITYENVIRKKKTIAKVIKKGVMPPWPADPSYSHFVGENILSEEEKKTLLSWIDDGAPRGDPGRVPKLPEMDKLSAIGTPDFTVWMDSILVEGINRDKFLVVKIPFELPFDTFIRAIEFVPGEHNLVHHMNGHLLNYRDDLKSDVFDGTRVANVEQEYELYREDFFRLKLLQDDGSRPQRIHSAVNYLPGVIGVIYPEGIGGFSVNKKAALVANDLHYGPIAKDRWDHSHFNIFFTDRPPERPTMELMLGTNGVAPIIPKLQIPPDTILTCSTHFTIPEDVSILTINPHMHLLGRRFLAYAVSPDSDTIPLIRINDWDFRWQYFYTFKKMLKIPKGSTIWAFGTFDNTAGNPYNPNDPPETVSERYDFNGPGMRTTDEMFQFIITYLPYNKGDEDISLETEYHRKKTGN